MTSACFIVHADREPESDGRIALACSLAERFDAQLIGVGAAMMDMPVVDPMGYAPIDARVIASERELLEGDLKAAAEKFQRFAAAKNLETEWRSSLEFPADLICREARMADLLIIGRGEVEKSIGPQRGIDPGDVLMQSGRPVLVVPPGVEAIGFNHVIVAWKDARESRRAVSDALPYLKVAKAVTVLQLSTDDEEREAKTSVADVVAYLRRHGIAATGETRVLARIDPASEIIAAAKEKNADLIVAGAYGHTRLREWVFGGVTYALIKKSPVCCLLSH
jgi:nucleotide-binding universal stress UspA family protein